MEQCESVAEASEVGLGNPPEGTAPLAHPPEFMGTARPEPDQEPAVESDEYEESALASGHSRKEAIRIWFFESPLARKSRLGEAGCRRRRCELGQPRKSNIWERAKVATSLRATITIDF